MKKLIKNLWILVILRWVVAIVSGCEPVAKYWRIISEGVSGRIRSIERIQAVTEQVSEVFNNVLTAHPEIVEPISIGLERFWAALLLVVPLLLVFFRFFRLLKKGIGCVWDGLPRLQPRIRPTRHTVFRYITSETEGVVDLNEYTREHPFRFTEGYSAYLQNGACYVRSEKTGEAIHVGQSECFVGEKGTHYVKVSSVVI